MDFSSAKFSLDGAAPDLLPEILHLPNHVVRQSCCVTIRELAELSYVGPYETPVVSETQTFDWDRDSLSFVVRDKTQEELNELKEPEDRKVRLWLDEEIKKPLHPTIAVSDLAPYYKDQLVTYRFALVDLYHSSGYLTFSDIPEVPYANYKTKAEAQAAYAADFALQEDLLKADFETKGCICLDPELQPFFKVPAGWLTPTTRSTTTAALESTEHWYYQVVEF